MRISRAHESVIGIHDQICHGHIQHSFVHWLKVKVCSQGVSFCGLPFIGFIGVDLTIPQGRNIRG